MTLAFACAAAEASFRGDGHRSVPQRSRSDPIHSVCVDASVWCFNGSPPFVAQRQYCETDRASGCDVVQSALGGEGHRGCWSNGRNLRIARTGKRSFRPAAIGRVPRRDERLVAERRLQRRLFGDELKEAQGATDPKAPFEFPRSCLTRRPCSFVFRSHEAAVRDHRQTARSCRPRRARKPCSRSTSERQVSSEETEADFGSSRPGAGAHAWR